MNVCVHTTHTTPHLKERRAGQEEKMCEEGRGSYLAHV